MNRQFAGACPPSVFGRGGEAQIDFEMHSPSECYQTRHSQHIPHDQAGYMEQNSYGFHFPLSEHYEDPGWEYQTQRSHQRHQSTSTQSTNSSYIRSSTGSNFSQFEYPRRSFASTNTAYSTISDFPREQHPTPIERVPDSHSPITSPPPPPPISFEGPTAPAPSKRASQRQSRQEKEPFQDCRSRTKRSRHSQKEPRYWCTSCEEGFREKYDWKRHEETYQERNETFACNLCKNIYFLDKDFLHHHQKSHRCQICAEDHQHADIARRKRMTRTGWGCGFCTHFSKDWAERCSHISQHFEKDHDTMANWHHSQVIWSLLQRPEILPTWYRLFEIKGLRTTANFSWKPQTTGRVEGYPEANPVPQLQDRLEFYTPDQSAGDIAQLAFNLGVRAKQTSREKDLPRLPARPPVPEKDYQPLPAAQVESHDPAQHFSTHPAPVPDAMSDAPWNTFLNTIIEDELQPTGACPLGSDDLSAAFGYVPRNFHSFQ